MKIAIAARLLERCTAQKPTPQGLLNNSILQYTTYRPSATFETFVPTSNTQLGYRQIHHTDPDQHCRQNTPTALQRLTTLPISQNINLLIENTTDLQLQNLITKNRNRTFGS